MATKMEWTGPDVLAATEGELVCGCGDFCFSGVSIDSRTVRPSHLFVAVQGGHHDGHDFITDVLEIGGKGFVVAKACQSTLIERIKSAGAFCLAVDDTVRALGALARYRRRQSGLIIVAITGTNGKTSTKEMTARVLEKRYRVLATAGNYNNEIGLPLTLLRLEDSHQVGVLEMGMNAPGEIARLTGICEPDIGVVLNVGEGHLAGLGNIDNVARAKEELVDVMGGNGAVVLNADDPRVLAMAGKSTGRVVTFGQESRGDVRALLSRPEDGGFVFDMLLPGQVAPVPVRLNGYGRHLVSNALAAAAVGMLLDVPAASIAEGLGRFAPVPGRMTVIRTTAGFYVVDDTYNANPASMRAAMETLKELKGRRSAFLVFGDMYELGEQAPFLHRAVGRWAAENEIDMLLTVGEYAETTAEGAVGAGMAKEKIVCGTKERVVATLKTAVRSGDWVLVKGSRAMTMETVVAAIVEAGGGVAERPERLG